MKRVLQGILDVFSSLGLSCVLLTLLGLLTYLGTLEQVDTGLFEVQKKYFESFVLLHDFGPFSLPLPGANLVMCVLFVNLVLGGMVRLRRGWGTFGVFVTHIGILMMLVAGFVKNYYSVEGNLLLYEGQSAAEFRSYHRWELVVLEELAPGRLREHPVREESLLRASGAQGTLFRSDALPFDLVVTRFLRNCQVLPKGPMFDVSVPVIDGVFLREEPLDREAESNVAGAYVTAVARDGKRTEGLVWGNERQPMPLVVNGKRFGIHLRKELHPLPIAVRLDKFTKEEHPRTMMAKTYSSDVTVSESSGTRAVKISMNQPLREQGFVLYQSSWGPQDAPPGTPLFSVLQVVRNPSDQWPLYSCLVIAAGLLIHFTRKLTRYIRLEHAKP